MKHTRVININVKRKKESEEKWHLNVDRKKKGPLPFCSSRIINYFLIKANFLALTFLTLVNGLI